jgi:hypothetical protein
MGIVGLLIKASEQALGAFYISVSGFTQVAPQGITNVLRIHSIFIRLLIRQRISAS